MCTFEVKGRKYLMQTVAKARMVILVSGKLNFYVKNLPDTGTVYTDKRITIRGFYTHQHIHTQFRITPIHGTDTNRHKGEIDGNTTIGDFNTSLTPVDRSSREPVRRQRF